MKKHIILIILALVMILSFCPAVYGAEQSEAVTTGSEVIKFNHALTAESESFTLSASDIGYGWIGGQRDYVTIAVKEGSGKRITRIEAVVSYAGNFYGGVGISAGTKREIGGVLDGTVAHVDNINAKEFSFTGGKYVSEFADITVYYDIFCDNHTFENGVCTNCGYWCKHNFENSKCTICGCPCNNPMHQKATCPDCGANFTTVPVTTASIVTHGSLTVIVGISSAIVFLIVGFILGRKKQSSSAQDIKENK